MELHIAAGLYRSLDQLKNGMYSGVQEYVSSISFGGFTADANEGNPEPRYWFDDETNSSYNCAGVPNLGIKHFCEKESQGIQQLLAGNCQLVVNLIPKKPGDINRMCRVLEEHRDFINVAEINVACPNLYAEGEQRSILAYDPTAVEKAVEESKVFSGERWLKIAPRTDVRTLHDIVDIARDGGVRTIVSGNTRSVSSVVRGKQRLSMPTGGRAGALLLPDARKQFKHLHSYCRKLDSPPIVMACGGVMDVGGANAFELDGACDIALGTYVHKFGTAGVRDLLQNM